MADQFELNVVLTPEIEAKVQNLINKVVALGDAGGDLEKKFAKAFDAAVFKGAAAEMNKVATATGKWAIEAEKGIRTSTDMLAAFKQNNSALVKLTDKIEKSAAVEKAHLEVVRHKNKAVLEQSVALEKALNSEESFRAAKEKSIIQSKTRLALLKEQVALEVKLSTSTRVAGLKKENDVLQLQLKVTERLNALKAKETFLRKDGAKAQLVEVKSKEIAAAQIEQEIAAEAKLMAHKDKKISLANREVLALKKVSKEHITYAEALRRVTAEEKKLTLAAKKKKTEVEKGGSAVHKFKNHIMDAEGATAAFRGGLRALGTSIGMFTSSTILAAAAVYGAIRAFRAMVEVGAEFEENMTRAFILMEEGAASFAGVALTEEVRKLGSETRIAVNEISEAVATFAMAGYDATQTTSALSSTVDLAVVGMLSMKEATDVSTSILAGFGLASTDLVHVLDDMATAVKSSKMNITQLGNAMSYAAPTATALGVNTVELIAAMEGLHNAGIKASRAGTGMRRVLLNLYNPTKKGTKALMELGIVTKDVVTGAARPFIDVMEEMAYAQERGVLVASHFSDIVGVRMSSVLAALTSRAGDAELSLRDFYNELKGNTGTLQDMSNALEKTVIGKWAIFKSALADLGVEIFELVKGPIASLLDAAVTTTIAVKDLVHWLGEMGLTTEASALRAGKALKENLADPSLWNAIKERSALAMSSIRIGLDLFSPGYALDRVSAISKENGEIDQALKAQHEIYTTHYAALKDFDRSALDEAQLADLIKLHSAMEDLVEASQIKDPEALEFFKHLGDFLGDTDPIIAGASALDEYDATFKAFSETVGGVALTSIEAFEEATKKMTDLAKAREELELLKDKAEELKQTMDSYEGDKQSEEFKKMEQTYKDLRVEVGTLGQSLKGLDDASKEYAKTRKKFTSDVDKNRDALAKNTEAIAASERALTASTDSAARIVQIRNELLDVDSQLLALEEAKSSELMKEVERTKKVSDLMKRKVSLNTELLASEKSLAAESKKRATAEYSFMAAMEKHNDAVAKILRGNKQLVSNEEKLLRVKKDLSAALKEQTKLWITSVNTGKLTDAQQKRFIALSLEIQKLLKEEITTVNALDKAHEKYLNSLASLMEEISPVISATKEYEEDLALLKKALDLTDISAEEFAEGLRHIKEELAIASASNEFQKMLVEWSFQFNHLDEVSAGWLDSFTNGLADALRGGKDAFDSFIDLVLNDLAKLAARTFVINLAGSFSGSDMSEGVSGLSSLGDASSGMSGLSTITSGLGLTGFGGVAPSVLSSTTAAGLTTTMPIAGTSVLSGVLTTIGTMIPWVIAIYAAFKVLSSVFGDDNANSVLKVWTGKNTDIRKEGESGKTWASPGEWLEVETPFGELGAGGRHIGVADDDQIPQEEFDAWLSAMGEIFEAVGALDQMIIDGLDLSEDTIADITRRVEAIDEEAQKMGAPDVGEFFVSRYEAIFDEIGGLADKMFENFMAEGLDEETVFEAAGAVVAMVTAIDSLRSVSEDAEAIMAQAALTQVEVLAQHRDAVYELVNAYDGTLESSLQLTSGLAQQREATLQLLVAIEQIKGNVNSLIAGTKEKIITDLMTDEEKFDYYSDQTDLLAKSLTTMTDPEEIMRTMQEIDALIGKTWDLQMGQGDEASKEVQQEYLDYLDELNTLAQERLDIAKENATTQAADLATAVEEAINKSFVPAAEKIEEAGEVIKEAGGDMKEASGTLIEGLDGLFPGDYQEPSPGYEMS